MRIAWIEEDPDFSRFEVVLLAYINDLYIHVVDEELSLESEISSHPVETGIDVIDTIKESPAILSLTGKIVDYEAINWQLELGLGEVFEINGHTYTRPGDLWGFYYTVKAADTLAKLKQIKATGAIVHYLGRNDVANLQIKSLKTTHPYTNAGGADFTMELQQFRAAGNSYIEPVQAEQTEAAVSDGGQQQVEKGDTTEVTHTVKPGDTVWGLVEAADAPYKNLSRPAIDGQEYSARDWVMAKNPEAFSVYGDFRTMQNGATIIVGYNE